MDTTDAGERAPVAGTDEDVRRVARYRAVAVARLLAGAAFAYLVGAPVWTNVLFLAAPLVAAVTAPGAARVRADRGKACVDAATFGFYQFLASAVCAVAGAAIAVLDLVSGVGPGWLVGLGLLALLPVDYLVLRRSLHLFPQR